MSSIGSNGKTMDGTWGVNLGSRLVNEYHGRIGDDYRTQDVDYMSRLRRTNIQKSMDDDEFKASFWRRHYRLSLIGYRSRYDR